MTPQEASSAYWTHVQSALKRHGFDPGEIDGERGPKTDGAILRFKASRGLRARSYVGPITEARLWEDAKPLPTGLPRWVARAHRYLGLKEVPGGADNPQIVAWWDLIGAGWFDDDETPWCGAFVGGVLAEEGIEILPGAQAPRARAWESWGQGLAGPALGSVVTFWRGSKSSGAGHVAFVVGRTSSGRIVCLGGNQKNRVSVANFDRSRETSYRWPGEEVAPNEVAFAALPVVEGGHISVSEA